MIYREKERSPCRRGAWRCPRRTPRPADAQADQAPLQNLSMISITITSMIIISSSSISISISIMMI